MIHKTITTLLLLAFLLEVAHGSSSFVRANSAPGQILIKSGVKIISVRQFDKSIKKPPLLNRAIAACKADTTAVIPSHLTWNHLRMLIDNPDHVPSSEQDDANDDACSAAHTALLTHTHFFFNPAFYRNLFSKHIFLQSLDLLNSVHRPPIALS